MANVILFYVKQAGRKMETFRFFPTLLIQAIKDRCVTHTSLLRVSVTVSINLLSTFSLPSLCVVGKENCAR